MTHKRMDGRHELILDPELPIVDAHHHLFHRPALRYLLDEYLEDVQAGHRIMASVYVETQAFERITGPELLRPLGEIEFANGVGAMSASGLYGDCRVCAAVVGYVDMRQGDAVGRYLDRAMECAPDRFRGVRQVTLEHASETPFRFMTHRPPSGILAHPNFRLGFSQLASRDLSFDVAVFHTQLGEIARLADSFLNTTIVLNHCGMLMGMEMSEAERAQSIKNWEQGLRDLARRPNVYCKVGGFGMPFWGFGFESRADALGYEELAKAWRPFVETSIDAFGVERCMMESNFPPDGRSCGFVPLWNALKFITKGCSVEEKAAMFHQTAAKVYQLDLAF